LDAFTNLMAGLEAALQPINFFYCFIGTLLGTLLGVLPGIGPLAGIALLLPLTYGLTPTAAMILLAGVYYGCQYGGSTTSILMNVPGEVSSIVTCLDGNKMAKQGRAGAALGIAAFGSFIAGTGGVVGLMLISVPVAKVTVKFGPPEFFSLMVLAIVILTSISRGSTAKAMIMAVLGFILSFIGIDPVSGRERLTFGSIQLTSGIELSSLAIGLFGVSEMLINMEESIETTAIQLKQKIKGYLPTLKDWRMSAGPITRGTIVGFVTGTIPGGGAIVASFVSYALEKRLSKHPEKFGTGTIEGVAGPESANNSATSGAFIPLLTMGIPSNVIMALLLGALMIHGIRPGPLFLVEHKDIFWAVIGSMYIGNVMLLVLNLPLIPLWVQLLKVPNRILLPTILLICVIGSYSVNNNVFDILVMALAGIAGYVLRKSGYEVAPLCLAFVLGPTMENSFRQALIMSDGSFSIFVTRPIAAVTLAFAALALGVLAIKGRKIPGVQLDT